MALPWWGSQMIPDEYKPEYLLAIGHLEAEWNQIEGLLFVIFKRFIGARTPKADVAFFSIVNHRSRREMIESLAPIIFEKEKMKAKKFAALMRRLKNAATKRNEVVHTFWAWQNGVPWAIWPHQTRITAANLLDEFRTRAATIKAVRLDLTEFYLKLSHVDRTWPPKRPQPRF